MARAEARLETVRRLALLLVVATAALPVGCGAQAGSSPATSSPSAPPQAPPRAPTPGRATTVEGVCDQLTREAEPLASRLSAVNMSTRAGLALAAGIAGGLQAVERAAADRLRGLSAVPRRGARGSPSGTRSVVRLRRASMLLSGLVSRLAGLTGSLAQALAKNDVGTIILIEHETAGATAAKRRLAKYYGLAKCGAVP